MASVERLDAAQPAAEDKQNLRRVVTASFIGTTIEWYDFFLYGTAAALVFNELPGCEEPSGVPKMRDVVADLVAGFNGPVLFGLPSGHTPGATLTIPFGVTARVDTGTEPGLIIEEAAVV